MYTPCHMEPTISTGRVVALADEWRRSLGLHHRGLSQLLHRDETEWAHLRAGRRHPSQEFVLALLTTAPEPWRSAFARAHTADLEARARLLDPMAGRKEEEAHAGVS